MDYRTAIRAEIISQKLSEKDGRGFPTTVFHSTAYQLLKDGEESEYISKEKHSEIDQLLDAKAYFDNKVVEVKEFEDLPEKLQEELMNSGLVEGM